MLGSWTEAMLTLLFVVWFIVKMAVPQLITDLAIHFLAVLHGHNHIVTCPSKVLTDILSIIRN